MDPTGELLELTGSEQDRKIAFERIKELVGEEAAKYLSVKTCYDADGTVHYYVDYDHSWVALAAKGGELGVRISEIIDSPKTLEFRVATEYDTINGHKNVYFSGGAATVGAEESTTLHTQIFVAPNAGDIAQERFTYTVLGMARSNDGKPLDFYNDIVDAHEFGHGYANLIDGVPVNSEPSNKRARDFENIIRERRGLPNRRVIE
jgi:hypothetical protein